MRYVRGNANDEKWEKDSGEKESSFISFFATDAAFGLARPPAIALCVMDRALKAAARSLVCFVCLSTKGPERDFDGVLFFFYLLQCLPGVVFQKKNINLSVFRDKFFFSFIIFLYTDNTVERNT